MRKLLKYLHRKPKEIRDKFALTVATVFTGVVALVWFVGTGSNIFGIGDDVSESKSDPMFSGFIKQTKEQFASVKDALGQGVDELSKEEASVISDSSTDSANENKTDQFDNILLDEEDLSLIEKKRAEPYNANANSSASATSSTPNDMTYSATDRGNYDGDEDTADSNQVGGENKATSSSSNKSETTSNTHYREVRIATTSPEQSE